MSDLGVTVNTSDLTMKAVCTKRERMKQLMVDMNHKYESIVSMLAQMNGQKGGNKDKQAEGSVTLTPTSSGTLTPESDYSSGCTKRIGEAKSTKLPKIDFPYLNREGPREWLR